MTEQSSESRNASKPLPRSIQIGRVQIAVNVIVQTIAMFLLVVMANFLSFRHHRPIDWSSTGKFTLSPQTLKVLEQFQEPCKVVVYFFYSRGPIFTDTVALLREYEVRSGRKMVVEVVNAAEDPVRAKELQGKYKFSERDNIVIVDYKGNAKWVEARDFVETEELPIEKQIPNEGVTERIKSFKGEQYITAAMMDLVEDKQYKVYLVNGHGEFEAGNPEFKLAMEALERQNFKVENLSLIAVDKVPDDASALVIAGPQKDLTERDVKLLNEYWARNGRVYAAVGPEAKAEWLTKWLASKGIAMRNDVVINVTKKRVEGVVDKIEVRPAEGLFIPGSVICNGLVGNFTGFLGESQSIGPVPSMLQNGEISFAPLVTSHPDWWGELDPIVDGSVPEMGPKDRKGPLVIAAAMEKGAARDPQVKLQTPRLVVVGNGSHLSDTGIRIAPLGKDLLVNSLNWLLSRETLIELPAKEKPMNDVSLNDDQLANLGWALILGLPSAVGLLGLYYISWRHGRNLIVLSIIILSIALAIWGAALGIAHWTTPARSGDAGEVTPQ